MSRDSAGDQPTQRTVAELLAEYGNNGSQQSNARRRRRRAEDPTETAPQAIIDRVLSDSGKMRPIDPDADPPVSRGHRPQQQSGPAQPQRPQPAAPVQPQTATPQPGAAPPAPVQPPPPEPPQTAPPAEQQAGASGGTGYWAQRLAHGNQAPAQPGQQAQGNSDAEATLRHPPVRPQPQAPPVAPAQPPQNATQQIRRPEPPAFPAQPAPEHDPYDFDDSLAQDYPSGGYAEDVRRDGPPDYDDDFDSQAPAGLDGYPEDEPDRPASAGREWGTLVLQGIGGLIGGGAVWIGFRWLWINATIAAFAAALVFTGLLVLVAWKFFRTNDLQTILLSVLVGLFCTVSPAVLLLIGH